MSESEYYPLGAEHDPNAPYNQSDPDEMEFNVCISQTLSKSTTVYTTDYIPGESGVNWDTDIDDEGHKIFIPVSYHGDPDTSDTDFKAAYEEGHYTPLELIRRFKEYLTIFRGTVDEEEAQRSIDILIKECEGWTEDETEVVEE